jgi:PHP domain-containing protein
LTATGPVTGFAHLHVASSDSLRYGTASPAKLAARAAELGMPSLALTDRDGLYGAFKHVKACADAGIKPLLGADLALRGGGGGDAGDAGRPGGGGGAEDRGVCAARGGDVRGLVPEPVQSSSGSGVNVRRGELILSRIASELSRKRPSGTYSSTRALAHSPGDGRRCASSGSSSPRCSR